MEAGEEMSFERLDGSFGRVEVMVVRRRELVLEAFCGEGANESVRGFVVESVDGGSDIGVSSLLVAKIIPYNDICSSSQFDWAGEYGIGIIILEYGEVGHASTGREGEAASEVR
jgi:hypothetical protein